MTITYCGIFGGFCELCFLNCDYVVVSPTIIGGEERPPFIGTTASRPTGRNCDYGGFSVLYEVFFLATRVWYLFN